MADDDKQIELRKRARRRLVGAVALALLAAIVLPMVMDTEPRPVEQDIQVRIPAQAGDNAAARPIAEPAKAVSPAEPGEPERADVTPPPMVISPARQACGCRDARTEECGARQAPARQAGTRDESAKPGRRGRTRSSDSRGQALGRSSGQGGCASLGRFRRAVGRLSRPDQCQQPPQQTQGRRLSRLYRAGGDKTRVRVGPYPSREAAEAAMAKLKRIGLSGAVLTL